MTARLLCFFSCLVATAALRAAGPDAYYEVENIVMPAGLDPQVGGMDALPDGRVAVCFHRGEVMLYAPKTKSWSEFARGLHEPLGLMVVNEREILVMQRAELTRLRDEDGDGKAEVYETVWDGFGLTGNYHEFAYGPVRDAAGQLYVSLNIASGAASIRPEIRGEWNEVGLPREAFYGDWKKVSKLAGRMYSRVPWRGWVMKIDPKTGGAAPFACGFRSPDGLGIGVDGEIYVADNQGDWVMTSMLHQVREGGFHGHPASLVWRPGWTEDPATITPERLEPLRTKPVVLFPHGLMANSPSQMVWDRSGGKFGPFSGQMFIGEMNRPRLMRVVTEKVGGQLQGAVLPFMDGRGLRAGLHRAVFSPDGSLWTGSTHLAWAGGEGLQRISWTGKTPLDLAGIHIQPAGFQLAFTLPLDRATAPAPSAIKVRHYHYKYHGDYGSPQFDLAQDAVKSAALSDDGRTISLDLGPLKAGMVYEITLPQLVSTGGDKLVNRLVCYTVNAVP